MEKQIQEKQIEEKKETLSPKEVFMVVQELPKQEVRQIYDKKENTIVNFITIEEKLSELEQRITLLEEKYSHK